MKLPRRQFMRNAAAATAALTLLPRGAQARPRKIAPSDRVNIAAVGVGGMGRANLQALSSQNIVALCDVDWDYAGKSVDRFTKDLEDRKNPPAGGRGRREDRPPPRPAGRAPGRPSS